MHYKTKHKGRLAWTKEVHLGQPRQTALTVNFLTARQGRPQKEQEQLEVVYVGLCTYYYDLHILGSIESKPTIIRMGLLDCLVHVICNVHIYIYIYIYTFWTQITLWTGLGGCALAFAFLGGLVAPHARTGWGRP